MTPGIYGFRGEYSFLSNFYPVDILIPNEDGVDELYKSAEHFFMSCKVNPNSIHYHQLRKQIMDSPTGAMAKKFASRHVMLRPNWHDFYRLPSMRKALSYKFAIPEMWDMLNATDDLYIEETNAWKDNFWGVCNGEGKNMLGKLLMKIRDEYRKY